MMMVVTMTAMMMLLLMMMMMMVLVISTMLVVDSDKGCKENIGPSRQSEIRSSAAEAWTSSTSRSVMRRLGLSEVRV